VHGPSDDRLTKGQGMYETSGPLLPTLGREAS
jgi:hypothetical protein